MNSHHDSQFYHSAIKSKNAVCAFMKHSRYFHLMYNFTSIQSLAKKFVFTHVYRIDTACSYKRELIICLFLKGFSKGKGSSVQLICYAHTAFLLCVGQHLPEGYFIKWSNCPSFTQVWGIKIFNHVVDIYLMAYYYPFQWNSWLRMF